MNGHVNAAPLEMATQEHTFLHRGFGRDAHDSELDQPVHGQRHCQPSTRNSHSINLARNPRSQASPQRSQRAELQSNRAHHSFRRTSADGDSMMIQGPPSSAGRQNNAFSRPLPQISNGTAHRPPDGNTGRRYNDWTRWPELSIRISDLPEYVTTRDVWAALKGEGQIITIELFEDQNCKRDGNARVRFR